jgi:predicted XRE-type DNA-binding protein
VDDDVEAVDDDVEKDKVTLRVKQHRLIESVDHTIEDHEAKQRREDSKLKVSPPSSLPFPR